MHYEKQISVFLCNMAQTIKGNLCRRGQKSQGNINGKDTWKSNIILATVLTVNTLMKQQHREGRGKREEKKITSLT